MPRLLHLVLVVLLLAAAAVSAAAQAPKDTSPHSSAELISQQAWVQPGQPLWVALRLVHDPDWHSYWKNPGDSGMPTSITWELPAGFAAGDIQWPAPVRIDLGPLTSYGYKDELLLPIELRVPENITAGEVRLVGKAEWLICADICLPAEEQIELRLPVRNEPAPPHPQWGERVAQARAALPRPLEPVQATAHATDAGYVLRISGAPRLPAGEVYFYVDQPERLAHAAPQALERAGDELRLALTRSEYSSGRAERLSGVLAAPSAWDQAGQLRAIEIEAEVVSDPAPGMAGGIARSGGFTFWIALVFAFGGGILLNLMPCVFPVLSLKVMSFVRQSGEERPRMLAHGGVFAAGVVLSFLALAGLLLALRAAGGELGWGFQLQSPRFVGALALLFVGIGLSLAGVFEVGLSLTRAGNVQVAPGYRESFLTGVLATVCATPCTAPLMGAALGFALTRPAWEALAIFGALGAGMAAPYLLLSAFPAALRRLPRPGPWMETFKQAMAFPMFAAAVWLVWVFAQQAGVDGAALLLAAMVFLGLAAWIYGRWGLAPRRPARLAGTVAAVLVVALSLGVAYAAAQHEPPARSANAQWQPWSPALVSELRAAGRPVFIDFTAAWCLTCQFNERVTLASSPVQELFATRNVALLKADWTNRDPEITRALAGYDRSGVPVYVFYAPGQEAVLLPEVLTPGMLAETVGALPPSAQAQAQAKSPE